MAINREWHQANVMPKNPTQDQRLTWHVEHEKHCNCRKMPDNLRALIEAREPESRES